MEFVDAGTSSAVPNFHANPSSAAPRRGPSNWREILSYTFVFKSCRSLSYLG